MCRFIKVAISALERVFSARGLSKVNLVAKVNEGGCHVSLPVLNPLCTVGLASTSAHSSYQSNLKSAKVLLQMKLGMAKANISWEEL